MEQEITILNVYDNVELNPKFKTGFGFACVVITNNKTILFDTGGDSETLLSNLETFGIDPVDIDIIFLSHEHYDHVGGLTGFLEENNEVEVFALNSFSDSIKKQIRDTGANLKEVKSPVNVAAGVYSTGQLGSIIKEQSLVINSEKFLIVITGCAHPGIVNIIKKAKELFKREVYLALGGFHLSSCSKKELDKIFKSFKELRVEKTAPSHCTGQKAIAFFEKEYKDSFIPSGAGKKITI
jgi:7,8-dihydropterin-6-yl-methyl-4-(beta-D-ribofuranosyl)aminobenzene 5'-phosphate synthase